MSTNMKAVIINEYGDNRVVRLAEIALPEPQAGEVRIRIHAAGVNPVDWKIRDGAGQRMGMRLPIHLGSEISGTIDRLGDGAGRFRVGDAVYGIVAAGGFAGYAIARAADIALKPASLDFTEAAAVPAFDDEDQHTADDESQRHRHRVEQVLLDGGAKQQTQHRCWNKSDQHVARKPLGHRVVRDAAHGAQQTLAVFPNDRQHRAALNGHIEDLDCCAGKADQRAGEDQVAG